MELSPDCTRPTVGISTGLLPPEKADVLIVDDDVDVLDFLAHCLRSTRLKVETARDGQSALERIRLAPPEVVVSDVRMPGMDGYELYRCVQDFADDTIPFIFCSSLGDLPDRILGLRMGADDYIVKPIDPEELLLKIRLLLRRSRKHSTIDALSAARGESPILRGSLGDISVPEVLQIVGFLNLGEARLRFEGPNQDEAEIFVNHESVIHARSNGAIGAKAFCRILARTAGTFELGHYSYAAEPSMSGSLSHWLLHGLASLDQYRHLRDGLKPSGNYFVVQHSPELYMRSFDEATAEVLTLIETDHDLDRVLAKSRLVDLDATQIVSDLLKQGFIAAPLAEGPA